MYYAIEALTYLFDMVIIIIYMNGIFHKENSSYRLSALYCMLPYHGGSYLCKPGSVHRTAIQAIYNSHKHRKSAYDLCPDLPIQDALVKPHICIHFLPDSCSAWRKLFPVSGENNKPGSHRSPSPPAFDPHESRFQDHAVPVDSGCDFLLEPTHKISRL